MGWFVKVDGEVSLVPKLQSMPSTNLAFEFSSCLLGIWKRFHRGQFLRRSATIKDVALRAGCGVATASRGLNNTGPAGAKMRDRVLAALKELDFQFSEVGRSLQSNTTRTIGCVVPSIANPVYAGAVQGARGVFLAAGCQTLPLYTNYNAEIEARAIRMLIAKQIGRPVLTVSEPKTSEALGFIQSRQVPHCLLFNVAPVNPTSWSVDDHATVGMVADAFYENGHMNTGFRALKFLSSDRARQRYEGFVERCARDGTRKPTLPEIDESNEDLTELLGEFFQRKKDLTGIFASNDFLAPAATRSARELSLGVPGDLSIVSFDGIWFGSLVEPSLATITTDPRMLGPGAGETVLSMINGTLSPRTPSTDQIFRFRSGGSLAPLTAESKDSGKVAAFPLSNDLTKRHTNPNRRDQN